MTTTVTAKIQIRKGTAAQWTSANPTLLSGEVGYETDTNRLKIGDGTTAWASLVYHHDPDLATTYAALAHNHSGVYEPASANLQAHVSSTSNPHSVTAAQAGADAKGTAAGLIANHESAENPHPGYLTSTEGDSAYSAVGHTHSGTYEPADATLLKQADIDDTPVNGVTTAPVSSNWAYDHAALTTAHGITYFGASLVDDTDAGTARSTLGLGTAATTASTDYATAGHTHAQLHDAMTVADSESIDLTLTGQQISAAAIFGTTSGTVCQGNDSRIALAVKSDTTGIAGADQITNIVSLTQAEYGAITPSATTFYVITG